MEKALIEVPTMRTSTGIDLISNRIPDETPILMGLLRLTLEPGPVHTYASVERAVASGYRSRMRLKERL